VVDVAKDVVMGVLECYMSGRVFQSGVRVREISEVEV